MRLALAVLLPAVVVTQTISISNGAVVASKDGGIEYYKGIPYAQVPTGTLRLKPPKTLAASFGTITSKPSPAACPQVKQAVNSSGIGGVAQSIINAIPVFNQAPNESEDCLTLDVHRPEGVAASAKLPVAVWIYGGGFQAGATNQFDAKNWLNTAKTVNTPFIFVQMNYRVGAFGFLGGSQLSQDGSTNLGLRDQRLALQWIQDNIAAFGGDPAKVTIVGESAGAISVFDQTIINGGNNLYNGKPLFRAAIMDSGCVTPVQPVNGAKAQAVFDRVATAAGCALNTNVLKCLRTVPYQSLVTAANSVFDTYRSVDLPYLARPDPNDGGFFSQSPEVSVQQGKYVKVPVIIGNQEDEGTAFALPQRNITTDAQLKDYLRSYFPTVSTSIVDSLVNAYPDDDGSSGSPYRTGTLYRLYPQYKRLAAILGDTVFILQRRALLSSYLANNVKAWSYLASYLHDTPFLGTAHATDIGELFRNSLNPGAGVSIQTFYTAFIANLDPNSIQTAWTNKQNWTPYSASGKALLNLTGKGLTGAENEIIADDFRSNAYNILVQNWNLLRI